jgi:DNA-binding SARP family transcriptional activator/DNA polymerase III delta prime subunit
MDPAPASESANGHAARANGAGPLLLVLGPVALMAATGAEVALAGARQRRLLAGLTLYAGEALSADRLGEIVWGDFPPRSARENLHTYLWSLRRALAAATPDGRVSIETRSTGYVLRAGHGALDWDCFRDLAARAAGLLPADPRTAAALLRSALDLWRGTAAADVDGGPPSLAARIAAMEEARVAALEQRIDADLAIGRHRELASELAELVACYPLREQFRAHQMVALYRSGRQADALVAFHQLRRDLADELGVDPGNQLQELYGAILRGDPLVGSPGQQHTTLAPFGVSSPPASVPAGAGPHASLGQRAAAEEDRMFQGRSVELSRVLELLADTGRLPRVVQLHGTPGIGKTAFAYALARRCGSRGWPAVIIDSRDFGHNPAELTEAIATRCAGVWSPGRGSPLLLVLDTAEEMRDIEHYLWDVILPGLTGEVLVLLCGRRPTPVLARSASWRGLVDQIELPPLSELEASRLVESLGITDPAVVRSVVAFARGNPLFIAVAAQYAWSPGSADLDVSGAAARSLVGRMTQETADPQLRRLLEAASLVRTFNEELLATMLDHDVSGSFRELCALSFIRAVHNGARLHDLVRDSIAADLLWRAPQACRELRQRAYRYLARNACSAPDAGPFIQELLHMAADATPLARFFAQGDHSDVHIRPVRPDDLPRLIELSHAGVTRFGYPPAERARQLEADFPVVQRDFVVSLNEAGALTGFAYYVRLNRHTWRTAAETRQGFFAALPEPELTAITTAPATFSLAFLIAGQTHLPGYARVSAALREALFSIAHDRDNVGAGFVAYHLLTPDCPELPEIIATGQSRRTRNIMLSGCTVDEWLLSFGDGGLVGWVGDVLGLDPAGEPEAVARKTSAI